MKLCLITNIFSPHQMPLAKALVERVGETNFRYVATDPEHDDRKELGWSWKNKPCWLFEPYSSNEVKTETERWKIGADVIICGNRDFDCFEKRTEAAANTFYMSERWLKPPLGVLRFLYPSYFRMALRFCRLLRSPTFFYLPMGVPAAKDMLRMVRLFARFPRWFFREPLISAEELSPKLLLWGYFVEPAKTEKPLAEMLGAKHGEAIGNKQPAVGAASTNLLMNSRTHELLRVLWVGRMLNWKRVDTLIKAVGCLLKEDRNIQLTLVGQGPEEARLRKLADKILAKYFAPDKGSGLGIRREPPITFHPPVPIAQVRDFMRQADVFVLPSDGGEGWGAVVNEAMEEGCAVIATHECGAGATMIRDGQNGLLFHAGDVIVLAKSLRRMQDESGMRHDLANGGRATVRQIWGPVVAAERLVAFCQAALAGQPRPRYSDGPLSEALG